MSWSLEEQLPSLCRSYGTSFGAALLTEEVAGVSTEIDQSIARVDEAAALAQPLRREVEEVTTTVLETLKRSGAKLDRLFTAVDALEAYVNEVDAATTALEARHAEVQSAFSAKYPTGVQSFLRALPLGFARRMSSAGSAGDGAGADIAAWEKPAQHIFTFDETKAPEPELETANAAAYGTAAHAVELGIQAT
jgi:hypothetical protein